MGYSIDILYIIGGKIDHLTRKRGVVRIDRFTTHEYYSKLKQDSGWSIMCYRDDDHGKFGFEGIGIKLNKI